MIAVDTNILIYAHRKDSVWNEGGKKAIAQLAEGRADWAIPWPSIHEFLAIVTHTSVYSPPTGLDKALIQVEEWLKSPTVQLIGESGAHWSFLKRLMTDGQIAGGKTHDAKIAALCLSHGVSEFWTADRDFSRFPELKCRNPLL